ncbi:sialin isoform X1 [Dermatophagoides farinae]|uniref:sialin isoform X1 n=1 Tax=Dermatophagoides farinae TaxID=6954 RepID=UPI003F6491B5
MLINVKKSPNGRFIQRFIPARFIFIFLSSFGFFLVYAYKVVLSMAIVSMVKTSTTKNETIMVEEFSFISDEKCPGSTEVDNIVGEFDWSETIKNNVLAAFFYGYVCTQIPAGIFSNKFGSKWIFSISLLIAAICSLLSPIAARQSYIWFFIVRFIQGLAEGFAFPCMNMMIAQWIPKMELSRGTTLIYTGAQFGTVFTLPIAAQMNGSSLGWTASFYLLGIIGIVWFILFATLVFESPELHPFISQKEFDHIVHNGGGKQIERKLIIPYREIFTSIPVYGLILTHFGQNWAFLTILTYMPTYMKNVLHTNNTQNTIISGLPYLGQALFGWICSFISDKLRSSGRLQITTIRKINNFIGFFFSHHIAFIPPAICIALIPTVGCNQIVSCILLILAVTFNGASFSGFNSTHVDMAPDFAGVLMGFTNSFGNVPGFVVPKVVNLFTNKESTIKSWSYVFYVAIVVNILSTLIYTFMCTAKEQIWGRMRK